MLRRTIPSRAAIFGSGGSGSGGGSKIKGPVAVSWNISNIFGGCPAGAPEAGGAASSNESTKKMTKKSKNLRSPPSPFSYQRLQRPSPEFFAQMKEEEARMFDAKESAFGPEIAGSRAAPKLKSSATFASRAVPAATAAAAAPLPPSSSSSSSSTLSTAGRDAEGYDFVIDTTELGGVINEGWPVFVNSSYKAELEASADRNAANRGGKNRMMNKPCSVVSISGSYSRGKSYCLQSIINATHNPQLDAEKGGLLAGLGLNKNKAAWSTRIEAGVSTRGVSAKFAATKHNSPDILFLDMAGRNAPAARGRDDQEEDDELAVRQQRRLSNDSDVAAAEPKSETKQSSSSSSSSPAALADAATKSVQRWFSQSTALAPVNESDATEKSTGAPKKEDEAQDVAEAEDDDLQENAPVIPHDERDIAKMLDQIGLERTKERVLDELHGELADQVVYVVDELLSDDQRILLHLIRHAKSDIIVIHNFKRLLGTIADVRTFRKHVHAQVVAPFNATPVPVAAASSYAKSTIGDSIPRCFQSVWAVPHAAGGDSESSITLNQQPRTIRRRGSVPAENKSKNKNDDEEDEEAADDGAFFARRRPDHPTTRYRKVHHFVLTKGVTDPRLQDSDPNLATFREISRLISENAMSAVPRSGVTRSSAMDVIACTLLEKMFKYGTVSQSKTPDDADLPTTTALAKSGGPDFTVRLSNCDSIKFFQWQNWPSIESTEKARVPHRQLAASDGSYVVEFDLPGLCADDFISPEDVHRDADLVADFASDGAIAAGGVSTRRSSGRSGAGSNFFCIESIRNSHRLLLSVRLFGRRAGTSFSEIINLRAPGSHRITTRAASDERPHGFIFNNGLLRLKFRVPDDDE